MIDIASRLLLAVLSTAMLSSCHAATSEERAASLNAAESSSSGPEAAAAASQASCGEISACTDRCGGRCPSGIRKLGCLMGCKNDCRASGCGSAKKLFDDLTGCIQRHCLSECMAGPTAECRSCTEKECASETLQCLKHACP